MDTKGSHNHTAHNHRNPGIGSGHDRRNHDTSNILILVPIGFGTVLTLSLEVTLLTGRKHVNKLSHFTLGSD